MARKRQTIKVKVHISTSTEQLLDCRSIEEFWIEKIAAKLQKEHMSNERIYDMIEKVSIQCNYKSR